MNSEAIERSIQEMLEGHVTPRKTIERLVSLGLGQRFAEFEVFINLGGDDIVIIDDEGRRYYRRSGRLVDEVQRLLVT